VAWQQMMMSSGSVEAGYKESRQFLLAEKYMNTDAVDVEDRAAGTRRLFPDCVTVKLRLILAFVLARNFSDMTSLSCHFNLLV